MKLIFQLILMAKMKYKLAIFTTIFSIPLWGLNQYISSFIDAFDGRENVPVISSSPTKSARVSVLESLHDINTLTTAILPTLTKNEYPTVDYSQQWAFEQEMLRAQNEVKNQVAAHAEVMRITQSAPTVSAPAKQVIASRYNNEKIQAVRFPASTGKKKITSVKDLLKVLAFPATAEASEVRGSQTLSADDGVKLAHVHVDTQVVDEKLGAKLWNMYQAEKMPAQKREVGRSPLAESMKAQDVQILDKQKIATTNVSSVENELLNIQNQLEEQQLVEAVHTEPELADKNVLDQVVNQVVPQANLNAGVETNTNANTNSKNEELTFYEYNESTPAVGATVSPASASVATPATVINQAVTIQKDSGHKRVASLAAPVNTQKSLAGQNVHEASFGDSSYISNRVANVIDREMKSQILLPKKAAPAAPVFPVAAMAVPTSAKDEMMAEAQKAFAAQMPQNSEQNKDREKFIEEINSTTELRVFPVVFNKGFLDEIGGVEFRPNFSEDKYIITENNQSLQLKTRLNKRSGIVSGQLFREEYVPVRGDFLVEKGMMEYKIPMFALSQFNTFLEKMDLKPRGGFLLVELDPSIQKVTLETEHDKSYLFDENFRPTRKNPSYILFVNTHVGNSVVRFQYKSGEMLKKVIHLVDDEIVFESTDWYTSKRSYVEIFETHLFEQGNSPIELNRESIMDFSSERSVARRGFNRFEVSKLDDRSPSRSYFELTHLDKVLFVGLDQHLNNLEIPDADYMDKILEYFSLENLQNDCVIQVNFAKAPDKVEYSTLGMGKSDVDVMYLTKRGEFLDEIDDQARRMFIHGRDEGMISVKVQYKNGRKDYFNTFCSLETYLVEHL